MDEPQAFLNGEFVSASRAAVSAMDAGFVQGTTVAEQLRTFGGKIFRLRSHVERLFHSLAVVEVDPGLSREQFVEAAEELVARNHPLLAHGDDLGLAMFVTPGPYAPMVAAGEPTVCLHTFSLRFNLWAEKYERGEWLATTDIPQVTAWPAELKCRSRMHYYLADRQAQARHPGSRALMQDKSGFVTETTTANVLMYREDTGLIVPPDEKILPGITLAAHLELAEEMHLHVTHRDLSVDDLISAAEVFMTSTSVCVLPVTRVNGQPIGSGRPGPRFRQFLAAWNELVGMDVQRQAMQFAVR